MGRLKDYVVDKYLTWKTGKPKDERDWREWYDRTVLWYADDITNMFQNFKHVIVVDSDKFMDPREPFAWVPNNDAMQYFWPQRPLETTCVWRFERVLWNEWDQRWHINGLGGDDLIFVATNSDTDALMISLKYAG